MRPPVPDGYAHWPDPAPLKEKRALCGVRLIAPVNPDATPNGRCPTCLQGLGEMIAKVEAVRSPA